MSVRVPRNYVPYQPPRSKKKHHRHLWKFTTAMVLLISCYVGFKSVQGHALAKTPTIKSAEAGYCLDDYQNGTTTGTVADIWKCNNSPAQNWTVNGSEIIHGNGQCLTVQGNGTQPQTSVVSNPCQDNPGQVWLRDRLGFENPNSGLCLDVSHATNASQLDVASCANLSKSNEQWTLYGANGMAITTMPCTDSSEGGKVACNAEREWTTWQSGTPDHGTLLNTYTDGTPYEEWCADFVSYVYKEAGYPFTGGESDGWDENNANNIQNMGFTMHQADGYTPRVGDVAYFDYQGGHVEIVVSGGQSPTFVYGNSATVDPTTGNGQMEANTITSDGDQGQVIYYLSPN